MHNAYRQLTDLLSAAVSGHCHDNDDGVHVIMYNCLTFPLGITQRLTMYEPTDNSDPTA